MEHTVYGEGKNYPWYVILIRVKIVTHLLQELFLWLAQHHTMDQVRQPNRAPEWNISSYAGGLCKIS